jgi:hypothetical protein
MSFMLVTGKIFRCAECQKAVQVDYEGGPLETQIGDMAVHQQLECSEHFGQPSADPYEEGFYLYDLAACQDCYENLVSVEDKALYAQIFDLFNKIETEREQAIEAVSLMAKDTVGSVASNLTLQDISKATGTSVDDSLGDKHSTATKMRRLITGFVQDHSNQIEAYILEKAFSESPIKQIIDQYRDETMQPIGQLLSLLDINHGKSFRPKHTNAAENLNDYIITSATVRCPVDDAIDEVFYYPLEYDVPNLKQYLELKADNSGISVHPQIGKKQIGEIIESLVMPAQVP